MKPIPPGYCEAADNAPIPGRPWWAQRLTGEKRLTNPPIPGVAGYTRSDGYSIDALHWASDRDRAADAAAACAAYDAAHPLPHPGYRAGQVWLSEDGVTVSVVTVTPNGTPLLVWDGPLGGAIVTDSRRKPALVWLLHDPLMPSRAPWGPA